MLCFDSFDTTSFDSCYSICYALTPVSSLSICVTRLLVYVFNLGNLQQWNFWNFAQYHTLFWQSRFNMLPKLNKPSKYCQSLLKFAKLRQIWSHCSLCCDSCKSTYYDSCDIIHCWVVITPVLTSVTLIAAFLLTTTWQGIFWQLWQDLFLKLKPVWKDGLIIYSIFGHCQQWNFLKSIKNNQSRFNILQSTK